MAPHANDDVTPQVLLEDGIQHSLEQSAALTHGKLANSVANGHTKGVSNGVANGYANGHTATPLSPLSASRLETSLTTTPREVPLPGTAAYRSQKTCTDHMITAVWTATAGWVAPQLRPYGPLQLMPTASVLHYATECFEGLKLYRGSDGAVRLFRPDLNCARMRMSAARVALPDFEPEELLKLVVTLCARDAAKWLPKERPGRHLYVRPSLIASDPTLGIQKPSEATLFIILCVFDKLDMPDGMRLLASKDDMVRAWPGGFGFAKVGANYGPTLVCQAEARQRGFDQILWLFGTEALITEAGASNFFVVWRNKDTGRVELVTAPLTDRIILDGVTRRSVLELARERLTGSDTRLAGTDAEPLDVVERQYSIAEVHQAHRDGRLLESFAAGTAFFICGVREIEWRGEAITTPVNADGCGTYASLLKGWLKGIMYGKERHEWGFVVDEE